MDEELLPLTASDQSGEGASPRSVAERDLPLVKHAASRFIGRGEELSDLIQTGAVGLIKAAERFDPSRGTRFSTYAYSMITGEIMRYLRKRRGLITVSLDELHDEGFSPAETFAEYPDAFERAEDRIFAEQLISSLPERERELIRLRYYSGLTQREAGRLLGVSQPQVSRIERRALLRLRIYHGEPWS